MVRSLVKVNHESSPELFVVKQGDQSQTEEFFTISSVLQISVSTLIKNEKFFLKIRKQYQIKRFLSFFFFIFKTPTRVSIR